MKQPTLNVHLFIYNKYLNESVTRTDKNPFSCGAYIPVEWGLDRHKQWLGGALERDECCKKEKEESGVLEVSGVCVHEY